MAGKRVSVCCEAPVKVEPWSSKNKHQLFTCTRCGLWPCEVKAIKKRGYEFIVRIILVPRNIRLWFRAKRDKRRYRKMGF